MPTTIWHGTKTNGVEIRLNDGTLDEVVLYVNGRCVAHVEQMSDQTWWMALYAKAHTVHVNWFSINLRSHVGAHAEGWEEDNHSREKTRRKS